jgi:hypothetical protein
LYAIVAEVRESIPRVVEVELGQCETKVRLIVNPYLCREKKVGTHRNQGKPRIKKKAPKHVKIRCQSGCLIELAWVDSGTSWGRKLQNVILWTTYREGIEVCGKYPLPNVKLSPIDQKRVLHVLLYNPPFCLSMAPRVGHVRENFQKTPQNLLHTVVVS